MGVQDSLEPQEVLPIAFSQPEYTHLEVLRFRSSRAADRWLKSLSRVSVK